MSALLQGSAKLSSTRALSTSCKLLAPAKLSMSNVDPPEKIRSAWHAPVFPVKKLTHLLDHDNHEMRQKFRQFISEPVMVPRYNISLAEERELALRRLQRICDNNFISVLDFKNNPLRIFAAHELAAIIDPAMTTKMTVQVLLFSSMRFAGFLNRISSFSSIFLEGRFSSLAQRDIIQNY